MRQLIFPMKEQYEEFLIDESKFSGFADSISFPESEEEIQEVLRTVNGERLPVTIQGGKTGITGAAVPEGGHVMNLSRMNKVKSSVLLEDGTGRITVEPGINLMDLSREIAAAFRKNPLFWPPDPTETSATAGGIAATNAQGISRLLYGPARTYIESLRLVKSDGQVITVEKGQKMTLPSGRVIDRIDAVLGKEGITGVMSELTLKLLPKPAGIWGIAFFFGQTKEAGRFVDILRQHMPECENAAVAAVEYIDRTSMDLIEKHKGVMTKIKELPDISEETEGMVYVELHGEEDEIELLAESLMETAMVCGSDPDEAWAVSGETDVEKLRAFRHGAAETANLYIEEVRRNDERITKLGTDMVISDMSFSDTLCNMTEELKQAGLKASIFGHALENHLHVNILPDDHDDYEKGIALIRKWAAQVRERHGQVTGEHGIGKLKLRILDGLLSKPYIELCTELKEELDAGFVWNRGNIIGGKAGGV
ncbi:FAD-binding oxidoreductase [[Clostridium] hylemonae]|uniref:FAD-binding oxidoreductase n=1 Tax=[Clostridium] hylemonae TaxID=89153 RepID=UPI001FCBB4D4|nr:FAD-binding oxidoreductase [[Clostridium] hylemonae]BDF03863.1 FAD-linked oxidase [[Clostridium] hylemonae]